MDETSPQSVEPGLEVGDDVAELSTQELSVAELLRRTGFANIGDLVRASISVEEFGEKYPGETLPHNTGEKPFSRISFSTQNGPQVAEATIVADDWVKIEMYDDPNHVDALSLNHLYPPRFVRVNRPIETNLPKPILVETGFVHEKGGTVVRATGPDGWVSTSHVGSKTAFMDNEIRKWRQRDPRRVLTTVDYTKNPKADSHKLPENK